MIYERTKTDFIWQLPDGSELHTSSKQVAEWIEALEKDAARYRWLRMGERDGVDLDYQEEDELDAAIDAAMKGKPKFANVSCSQCGRDFGPGDHGYSHCKDHP